MNTALIAFSAIFYFPLATGTDCQLVGVDYPGNDNRSVDDVESWQACGQICGLDPVCKAWTWLTPDWHESHRRKICYVKHAISDQRDLDNHISGTRDCCQASSPTEDQQRERRFKRFVKSNMKLVRNSAQKARAPEIVQAKSLVDCASRCLASYNKKVGMSCYAFNIRRRIGETALDCELSIQSCFTLETTKSDLGYSFYMDQEVLTAMEESRDFSNAGETVELGCMSLENHKSIHRGQWVKSGIHSLPSKLTDTRCSLKISKLQKKCPLCIPVFGIKEMNKTCDNTCSALGKTCDPDLQSEADSYEKLYLALDQADFNGCVEFDPDKGPCSKHRPYSGAPVVNKRKRCFPISKGSRSVCNEKLKEESWAPLCFCK